MFSKELENLIQATLEDGVLEEYEKAALVKRATAEGVDLAELEIYINSILQKRQRELNEKKNAEFAQAEQKKKEAIGKVCPKCGKQVTPLTLVCECGFEFTNSKSESSVHRLSEQINKINDKFKNNDQERTLQVMDAINLFPVPNTKEDIIEFLALSASSSKLQGGFLGSIRNRAILAISLVIVIFCLFAPEGWGYNPLERWVNCISGGFFYGAGIYNTIILLATIAGSYWFVCKYDIDTLRRNKIAAVWHAKFDQVLMKGRSLRGDAEFSQQLDYYENLLNKK